VSDAIADLVLAAKSGDRHAFGSLVELHWAMLVRLARSVAGEAEAEDLAQEALLEDLAHEALLVAWRKLGSLSEPSRFPSWITRIVFRRSLRRARRRKPEVALESLGNPGHTPDTESALYVWQVLSHLAPRQRAVLHLTVIEGMADSEIGTALGISASSVRVHRMRARERVVDLMKGERNHVGF
jgi:RNA polymerase sigma-70 factor, ECF subfamily